MIKMYPRFIFQGQNFNPDATEQQKFDDIKFDKKDVGYGVIKSKDESICDFVDRVFFFVEHYKSNGADRVVFHINMK